MLFTYAVGVSLLIWLTTDAISADLALGDFTQSSSDTHQQKSQDYSWSSSNALARSALVERQERLQHNCEEISVRNEDPKRVLVPNDFRNLLVDNQHELLYCYVPKVIFNSNYKNFSKGLPWGF